MPGWLLLCSDGLWNYASEPAALAEVFRACTVGVPPQRGAAQPAEELAKALVDWAKAQGGHDNITVALAYLLPTQDGEDPPAEVRLEQARPPRRPERRPGRTTYRLARSTYRPRPPTYPRPPPRPATPPRPAYPRRRDRRRTTSGRLHRRPSIRTSSCPRAAPTSHAIVTITCSGAGGAGQTGSGDAGEIIVVDTSRSMEAAGVAAAQYAAAAALDQILDGVWFAIVAGNHQARLCYPDGYSAAMVRMNPPDAAGRQGRR